jgi:diacylglycerol kinase family enzyme
VGGGLFADMLSDDEVAESAGADRGRARLSGVVEHARPVWWDIDVDGCDASGDFIAVETMNIKETGPNLALAPDSDPSDGSS